MNKNITASILVIIAVGIYFTVTSGMLADANKIKTVNDQYSSALGDASKIIANRDKVRDDYNKISEDDRDKLDKMIPSTVDTIRLIIDLNKIAQEHGFSIPDAKATAAADNVQNGGTVVANRAPASPAGQARLTAASFQAPVLDTVAVTFSAVADYNQFISFLRDLESNLRITDITSLSVMAKDNGAYSFQVKLQTYWLRQ